MKRIRLIALGAVLVASMGLFACSGGGPSDAGQPSEGDAPATVTETDVVSIDGLYVDDSYVDEESDKLKRVYVFYTLSPGEENLDADSTYMDLTINDGNTYTSEFYPGACDLMASYYYSAYLGDVYMGDQLKVAAVFEIPEADLASDRTIAFEDDQIPTIDSIRMSTSDIVHCASAEEIAQKADPEGYEQSVCLRQEADPETAERVRNSINGFYWSFFVNNMSYRTEFFAPNGFETTVSGVGTTGTYTVANGFVVLTNDSNDYVVEVPYSWDGDQIDLDLPTGYSVSE